MTDAVDPAERAGRPNPITVTTPAEFMEALRRLQRWTGLSPRNWRNAKAIGRVLPRSTLTAALVLHTLPRENLLTAFVLACGASDDKERSWLALRWRIAAAPPAPAPPAVAPSDTVPPVIRVRNRVHALTAVLVAVLAVTTLAVAFRNAPAGSGLSGGGSPPATSSQAPPAVPLSPPNVPPPAPDSAPKGLYVGDSIATEPATLSPLPSMPPAKPGSYR